MIYLINHICITGDGGGCRCGGVGGDGGGGRSGGGSGLVQCGHLIVIGLWYSSFALFNFTIKLGN